MQASAQVMRIDSGAMDIGEDSQLPFHEGHSTDDTHYIRINRYIYIIPGSTYIIYIYVIIYNYNIYVYIYIKSSRGVVREDKFKDNDGDVVMMGTPVPCKRAVTRPDSSNCL